MSTPDLLETIVAATRHITAVRKEHEPLPSLSQRAERATPNGTGFKRALSQPGRVNVIAECKRRSPSKGVLMDRYDPAVMATQYELGGAAAISVLTEPTFFDGALEHLERVRASVRVPLLRKDFVVDDYQLLEARAAGADAVLLIVAALTPRELARLQGQALDMGLAALVEVHDEDELSKAVDAGAGIIGVNNRNLRTLAVDLDASFRLVAKMPAGVVAVSESGLQSRGDLEALASAGYHAYLIGERFMTAPDPAAAVAELIGARARV